PVHVRQTRPHAQEILRCTTKAAKPIPSTSGQAPHAGSAFWPALPVCHDDWKPLYAFPFFRLIPGDIRVKEYTPKMVLLITGSHSNIPKRTLQPPFPGRPARFQRDSPGAFSSRICCTANKEYNLPQ